MNYYDSLARGYSDLYGEEQRRKVDLIRKHLCVLSSDLLLDVGCGSGISSKFPCASIGIDPSLELLRQGQGNVVYIWGVGEHLPFHDASFDIVLCVSALQNFSHISLGLLEMKRVCHRDFVLSLNKKSSSHLNSVRMMKQFFVIEKKIEEEKDIIYFCRPLAKTIKRMKLKSGV